MGLFEPVWKISDRGKRAKKLDRLNGKKLRELALNPDAVTGVRLEALDRMPEEALLSLIYDRAGNSRDTWICQQAADRLKKPDNLKAVATDPRLDSGVRYCALQHVEDEKTLEEAVRGELAGLQEKRLALSKLRNPGLIAELARGEHLHYTGIRKLEALKADRELLQLMLEAEGMNLSDANTGIRRFRDNRDALERMLAEARSDAVRAEALKALTEDGAAPAGARQEARKEIRRMIEKGETDTRVFPILMRCADTEEALTETEREFLYNLLRKDPLCWYALKFLNDCGDPAGKAFLCFYDSLYARETKACLTGEETERVLQVPEDFALDYLKAFAESGEGGNTKHAGPMIMVTGAAGAIRLMHERGKARERIEKELPQRKDYRCSYRYQDSENDIRSDTDEFTAVFWE